MIILIHFIYSNKEIVDSCAFTKDEKVEYSLLHSIVFSFTENLNT